jgi:hypothetical protein
MATPPHAATPVQARVVREPSIDPVVWATSVDPASLAPAKAVTTLTSDALNIYACLSAINLAKGTIVDASWSYNNTSLDAFSTRLTLPDSAPQRWVTFHITRDPNVPWPPGTYAISVAVDGKVIQEASIEVTSTA